jgi:hypothetical protein
MIALHPAKPSLIDFYFDAGSEPYLRCIVCFVGVDF